MNGALLDVLRLLGGGVVLYFGAEWLVGGAAGLARRLGIPQLLVGLTVVAYGTSAPEVVVGVQATLAGSPDLALGNIIGSNIANLGLILGAAALLKPAKVDGELRWREVPVLVLSAFAVPVVLADGEVHRWEGGLLVFAAVAYTVVMVRSARKKKVVDQATQEVAVAASAASAASGAPPRGVPRLAVSAVVGLAALVFGGDLFVDGASGLARTFGLSERLVGLTIVAVGTSLPELATSLIAAWRGHSDIAVGNVIGSNIFNVLLCLGTAASVGRVAAPISTLGLDLSVLLGMTVFGAVLMRSERTVTRGEGVVLLASYVFFVIAVVILRG